MEDPTRALDGLQAAVAAARNGAGERAQLLEALSALRQLREELAAWEPELIGAARGAGASWSALAPVLGVSSRQAAERRYLRLRPSATGETTGEGRVDAERGRRAGARAVAAWARENATALRQLAGRVSSVEGLDPQAQGSAHRVGLALGADDAADLLDPLAAAQPFLGERHAHLVEELDSVVRHADGLRRDAAAGRRAGPGS